MLPSRPFFLSDVNTLPFSCSRSLRPSGVCRITASRRRFGKANSSFDKRFYRNDQTVKGIQPIKSIDFQSKHDVTDMARNLLKDCYWLAYKRMRFLGARIRHDIKKGLLC
jgi:hypothetical protein